MQKRSVCVCLRVCQLIGANPARKHAGRNCRLRRLFEASSVPLEVKNTITGTRPVSEQCLNDSGWEREFCGWLLSLTCQSSRGSAQPGITKAREQMHAQKELITLLRRSRCIVSQRQFKSSCSPIEHLPALLGEPLAAEI